MALTQISCGGEGLAFWVVIWLDMGEIYSAEFIP